jgi:two-component system, OmpR family, sensor histidine kinase VicK
VVSDIGDADVGHLRGLQERLRTERDFSEALLQAAGCLILVLDPSGRVVRWNRICEETTGYAAAELDAVDDVMGLLVPDAEVTGARRVLADLLEGRVGPVTYVNHWRARTGELHLITWSNTAVTINGARHVIGTGIDVTELEQARRALRPARSGSGCSPRPSPTSSTDTDSSLPASSSTSARPR